MGILNKLFGSTNLVKEHPFSEFWVQGVGSPQHTKRTFKALSKEGYEKNNIVYRCISELAKSVAYLDFDLKRELKDGTVEDVKGSPLMQLIYNPNPMQSKAEFTKEVVSNYLLSGNSYLSVAIDNNPSQVWPISPEHVEVVAGKTKIPQAYKIGKKRRVDVDKLTGRSLIAHWKDYHPTDEWYGMSKLEAAIYQLDSYNEAQQWNFKLLRNDATVPYAIKTEGTTTLTPDQRQQLKNMLEEHRGAANSGKSMILEAGLDIKELGMSPKDMEYLEGQKTLARWLAGVYGVPAQLLNIEGDNTYANFEQAREALWENAVIPLAQEYIDILNRWLVPMFHREEEGIYLCLNVENISALEPKRQRKFDRLIQAKEAGVLTINEVRNELGHEDIEGGDTIYQSATEIPLGFEDDFADKQDEKDYIELLEHKDGKSSSKVE